MFHIKTVRVSAIAVAAALLALHIKATIYFGSNFFPGSMAELGVDLLFIVLFFPAILLALKPARFYIWRARFKKTVGLSKREEYL